MRGVTAMKSKLFALASIAAVAATCLAPVSASALSLNFSFDSVTGVLYAGFLARRLALIGGAHRLGVNPVGADCPLRPYDNDRLCVVECARDLGAESIARAQPRLVPPDRAGAETLLDGCRKITCQVAMP